MADRLSSLPNELLHSVAGFLSQTDRDHFAHTGQQIQRNAQRALFENAEILAPVCRSQQATRLPFPPCPKKLLQYLERSLDLGHFAQSLTFRTDFSIAETRPHNRPPLLIGNLPASHWLHFNMSEYIRMAKALNPLRFHHPRTGGDWLLGAWDSDYDAIAAMIMILNPTIKKLSLQSFSPDVEVTWALEYVALDMVNNTIGLPGHNFDPLLNVKILEIGTEAQGQLDTLEYHIDVCLLENLEELEVGFGIPDVSNPHDSLKKLSISNWRCRDIGVFPQLPSLLGGIPVLPGNLPHLAAHRRLITAITNTPYLEHLEITNSRHCDHMHTGYTYIDANTGAQMSLPSLPQTMRTFSSELKSFKMTTYIDYAQLAPFSHHNTMGLWLWSRYFNSFGPWDMYDHLEHLEMDCWYFFDGPAPTPPGMPVNPVHPDVLVSRLPQSIKSVRITSLVGGYCVQFWKFLAVVWQEKWHGGLPNLEHISFNRLPTVPLSALPPTNAAMTWQQVKMMLRQLGVTVVPR